MMTQPEGAHKSPPMIQPGERVDSTREKKHLKFEKPTRLPTRERWKEWREGVKKKKSGSKVRSGRPKRR